MGKFIICWGSGTNPPYQLTDVHEMHLHSLQEKKQDIMRTGIKESFILNLDSFLVTNIRLKYATTQYWGNFSNVHSQNGSSFPK